MVNYSIVMRNNPMDADAAKKANVGTMKAKDL
ncbi:unknown [Phocaeicola dorei CAG:222]|nr:unknown [Phocaeicola dorei CAG:222]